MLLEALPASLSRIKAAGSDLPENPRLQRGDPWHTLAATMMAVWP